MCKICRFFLPDNKSRAVYHNVSSSSVANMIVGACSLSVCVGLEDLTDHLTCMLNQVPSC